MSNGQCPTEMEERVQYVKALKRLVVWRDTLSACQRYIYYLISLDGAQFGLDNSHCQNDFISNGLNGLNGLDSWS